MSLPPLFPLTRRQFALGSAAAWAAPAIGGKAARVVTGLDRLLAGEGKDNRGEKIALLTHSGARDAMGRRSVDGIAGLKGINLLGLLSPEHGLSGQAAAGEDVPDGRDAATGLPIFSLYGKTRRTPADLLGQADTLMIDLQDVGLRPYTYAATMVDAMRLAKVHGLRVFLLDRPNPLGGIKVDGPRPAPDLVSIVGALPVAFRHGLTIMELALRALSLPKMPPQITGLAMKGWRRDMGIDVFGPGSLPFTPPSPNLRRPGSVLAYAATVLIEGTNLSEGRGTALPFEAIGAPWCDGARLAAAMTALNLPGVRFTRARFTPTASKHAGQLCSGVQFEVLDQQAYDPLLTGLSLIATARRLHPADFAFLDGKRPFFDLLIGQAWVREMVLADESPAAIALRWQDDVTAFRRTSVRLQIYS